MASDPVYTFINGQPQGKCQWCGIRYPIRDTSVAFRGFWLKKLVEAVVRVEGVEYPSHHQKWIRCRKRIQVCPTCADTYNHKIINNKSGYPVDLEEGD